MKVMIDIPKGEYNKICKTMLHTSSGNPNFYFESKIANGTPIPDNATNGDVIKAMFDDKVSAFMGYVRLMARVGNWFNDGVVAEFDKDWWNAPYQQEYLGGELYEGEFENR